MKVKTLIFSLLFSSAALVAVLLLPLYLKTPSPVEEAHARYGGADTHAKKVALAWVPRVSAILSLLVSMIVRLPNYHYNNCGLTIGMTISIGLTIHHCGYSTSPETALKNYQQSKRFIICSLLDIIKNRYLQTRLIRALHNQIAAPLFDECV